jgi:chromosome segregation protein
MRGVAEVALTLEARVADLLRSLAASEEVRARVEAALGGALVEIEALRAMGARDDGATVVAAVAAARIEELEQALVTLEAEVFGLGDAHAAEVAAFEEALRDRGRATHALERELERRERIILDLVHALEEARAEAMGELPVRVAAASDAAPSASPESRELHARREQALRETRTENEELRAKLDAAALEIARREGEATASAWRLEEMEQSVARLEDEQSELTMTIPPPAFTNLEREVNDVTKLTARLTTAEDELDMLRQALAQEHQARARAESGDALTQAQTELARQAALLEKLSRELEAHDGVRRSTSADDSATSTA